jgi:hypothetical protein
MDDAFNEFAQPGQIVETAGPLLRDNAAALP